METKSINWRDAEKEKPKIGDVCWQYFNGVITYSEVTAVRETTFDFKTWMGREFEGMPIEYFSPTSQK